RFRHTAREDQYHWSCAVRFADKIHHLPDKLWIDRGVDGQRVEWSWCLPGLWAGLEFFTSGREVHHQHTGRKKKQEVA
ncbi:MAG: hypothetical protein L0215_19075, partial [Gemmataceae bacterium]|nr:hypothetical protein [Gemmataceae bacterium]